jgi:AraC family transcriptional regulator, regulatory protein of adaptative response / DNA-3-methyladenine glycosylase II
MQTFEEIVERDKFGTTDAPSDASPRSLSEQKAEIDAGAEVESDVWWQAIRSRDRRFDGRFFVAAVTTGVYCRPTCPVPFAKPNNIALYGCAAAAETAGFRPCRRCRPETSPGTPAWLGTSAVVSRALRLIHEGALNDDGVDQLAERLGIGSRQLRRLFVQHLGASPVQIASTHRVHFARNLIEETDLPMSIVAMNAGFRSIRQFNHTLKATFGQAPSELRSSRLDHERPQRHSGLLIHLPYRPPFNWTALIAFLRARAIPGIESVEADSYRRTVESGIAKGVIDVSPDPQEPRLTVRIELSDYAGLMPVVERVRRIFDLGADPLPISERLARSKFLGPLVDSQPGIRVPGAWDGFELAVTAIVARKSGIPPSIGLVGQLVTSYGEPIENRCEGLTHLFPRPEVLAAADLSRAGIPEESTGPIRGMARLLLEKQFAFESSTSLRETISLLCSIPGIGEDAAEYIAMRACGEPDAFPLVGLGLVGRGAAQPIPEGLSSVIATSENWRPWKAYGAMLLWAANERHI